MNVVAVITALTGLIVAIGGVLKVWYDLRQLHQQLNSRLDEMLQVVSASEHAKGKLKGIEEEQARQQTGQQDCEES